LNGEIGALVDPENVQEIGQTLLQILSRKHPQQTLFDPEALRDRVNEAYGYGSFLEKLRRIIEPMIAAKHGAGSREPGARQQTTDNR
jgi:glycosyltransferase involved in cell wall biosynthesis